MDCLTASLRGLPMRFLIQLLLVPSVSAALGFGFAAHAQTAARAASRDEVEDLRNSVRELALRVSVLEEELRGQRAGTPVQSASLKPAALVLPAADVRSSVETVVSSGVADAAPVVEVSPQNATTQSAPQASALPTQLPGGGTLNYMLDAYYEYDFNDPIGRIQ